MRQSSRSISRARTWAVGLVLGAVAVGAATALVAAPTPKDWPMFGQNLSNTASVTDNDLTVKNVGELGVKWTLTTGGDVSARAAVSKGVVYFPGLGWKSLGGRRR